jgi:K+ transporter
MPLTQANVVGVVSVIFWALMIVVSLKYVILILRADNHGEGGIMALLVRRPRFFWTRIWGKTCLENGSWKC